MKEEFDVNQGHGDHNEALFGGSGEDDRGVGVWLPKLARTGQVSAQTEGPVKCSLGEGGPETVQVVYLSGGQDPLRLQILIGVIEKGKRNLCISAYPEAEGLPVEVCVTAIHEWANGVEATLNGTMLGTEERDISFFDTRYALHKGKYEIGKTYLFKLAALCYDDCEILPKEERKIVLTGEQAERIYKVLGEEPERAADGSVKPWTADQSTGVAYWSTSAAYPDDAYIQSPVFERVRKVNAFDGSYLVFVAGIARSTGENEDEVRIPLYARSEIFEKRPRKGDPIRGHVWVHGYMVPEGADGL